MEFSILPASFFQAKKQPGFLKPTQIFKAHFIIWLPLLSLFSWFVSTDDLAATAVRLVVVEHLLTLIP